MTRTLDEVDADLQNFKTLVPTTEELLFSNTLVGWPTSAGGLVDSVTWDHQCTLLVAPIPLKVLSVATASEWWTCAASDTAYWQATLLHGTGPTGFTTIATRTTQNTGANAGGGVTPRTAWTFDAAPWADVTFGAGDLLCVEWQPFGSPPAKIMPMTYTIRCQAV